MELIKDYKHDPALRASFEALAHETFGLNLEPWYRAGFWDSTYVPYSLAENGRVIANVSANTVYLTVDGRPVNAIMLGTVMTHKDYRGKGYAALLMNRALEEYRASADLIYLFANERALDFYPRFGFIPREEQQCFVNLKEVTAKPESYRILNIRKVDDLALVRRLISSGFSARKRLNVTGNGALILFYCLSGLENGLRYYPGSDTLLFYDNGVLLDYFSGSGLSLAEAAALLAEGQSELPLGFTPEDSPDYLWRRYNDHLFTLGGEKLTGSFMFPSLSRA